MSKKVSVFMPKRKSYQNLGLLLYETSNVPGDLLILGYISELCAYGIILGNILTIVTFLLCTY